MAALKLSTRSGRSDDFSAVVATAPRFTLLQRLAARWIVSAGLTIRRSLVSHPHAHHRSFTRPRLRACPFRGRFGEGGTADAALPRPSPRLTSGRHLNEDRRSERSRP